MSCALSRWQAAFLGFVVFASLCLGGMGLFALGEKSRYGRDSIRLSVGMPDIRGVEIGTRVRVQGIDAGEVDAINIPSQPGDAVVLELRLQGRFRELIREDASVQLVSEGMIGGRALEINPGSPQAQPVASGATLASRETTELADILVQVKQTLDGVRDSQGTVGKLLKDPDAYANLVTLLQQSRDTMSSIQEDADAVKKLPIVRNYVEDTTALLVRPSMRQTKQWIDEKDLFAPGEAILTPKGRESLDLVAVWICRNNRKGTEVVVASYVDPRSPNPSAARILTRARSEAVSDYLKKQHAVQKLGWFSSRKVVPVGMGTNHSPIPDKEPVPSDRTEIILFDAKV